MSFCLTGSWSYLMPTYYHGSSLAVMNMMLEPVMSKPPYNWFVLSAAGGAMLEENVLLHRSSQKSSFKRGDLVGKLAPGVWKKPNSVQVW